MARPEPKPADRDVPARGAAAPVRSGTMAWVLILVLAAGFLTALNSPVLRSPPEASLLDGSWTSAFEEGLMEGTALRSVATATWGVIDLVVFGQGLPGVLIGEDGWLFTTEEFGRGSVADRFTTSEPVAEIREVAGLLETDGVDLLVVLVPAKARVHDEVLGRYELPARAAARYDVLLRELREAGVEVVDGAEAMASLSAGQRRFLRTDTHWTPAGAQAVARRTAERIAEGHAGAEWFGSTTYEWQAEGDVRVEGDLLAFVPLGPFAERVGPSPDTIPRSHAVRTGGGGGGILGDVRLPVTLVGTSYSADERWGFADALRVGLGSDVLVAASEGEGPFDPMRTYLQSEAYETSRPEVVIWEIPERYAWPEVGW